VLVALRSAVPGARIVSGRLNERSVRLIVVDESRRESVRQRFESKRVVVAR